MLLVDDDPAFLTAAQQVFTGLGEGNWEVLTAGNHAQALDQLSRGHVDVLVLDVNMPVMDGVALLHLVQRTYPGLPTVMISGAATEEMRERCTSAGASLFVDKLLDSDGYSALFEAINSLATAQSPGGFQGLMRRVGLQEVLQLECLGRKSSVLEVFTRRVRGRIYICEGAIVHAASGSLKGEMALYGLLALRGGGFNLMPYQEPDERTIAGHWEFLLMEGARLADEGSLQELAEVEPEAPAPEPARQPLGQEAAAEQGPTEVSELVLCSGAGEILHIWNCEWVEYRRMLLRDLERHARELMAVGPIGAFEQVEVRSGPSRIVCQARMDRQLFLRTTPVGGAAAGQDAGTGGALKESPGEVIARALPLPGLAAWGILTPQSEFRGECLTDWLWPEQIEQLTRKLKAACALFPAHRLDAGNTCWVYERARLYARSLPDQACIVLVVESRAAANLSRFQDLLRQICGTP